MAKILAQKFYDEMKKLEPRYPRKVALLLPALHAAQEQMSQYRLARLQAAVSLCKALGGGWMVASEPERE